MSAMSELFLEVMELIENTQMSFQEIAKTLDIPLDYVYDVAEIMGEFDE
jgi:predicted XRE-type DNA-binding protein